MGTTGMTGMTWGPRGQHGVETTVMGTTWGPSGGYGDDVGTTGMTWGQRGLQGPWGKHGEETTEQTTAMGTTWRPSGGYGDDGDDTRMMWGRRGQPGDDGDNKITKNAITFEQIKIIEFCLKIWDPWTLPHTCTLQLMCRWGGVLSQITFLSKKCSGDPQKIFFLFLHWIPLDHI